MPSESEKSNLQFILAVVLICAAVVSATVFLIGYVNDECRIVREDSDRRVHEVSKNLTALLEKHANLEYHPGMTKYVDGKFEKVMAKMDVLQADIQKLNLTMARAFPDMETRSIAPRIGE